MLETLCYEIFIIQVVFIGLKVDQGLFSLAIAFLSLLPPKNKLKKKRKKNTSKET
jgi:hypothetical protein